MEPKTFEIVKYTGPTIRTRGEYGEDVISGRIDPEGGLYVFDSTYGWSFWSVIVKDGVIAPDWERTGEMAVPVEAQW